MSRKPNWSRRLTWTVEAKDSDKPMHTLADVVAYMDAHIPKERVENERDRWHAVGKALLECAEKDGDLAAFTRQLMYALLLEKRLKME
jgi:hypothetical protein